MQKSSMNKGLIIGRLGKTPETKYTASQVAICSFSVATTDSFKDSSGDYKDKTEWHSVTAFSKLGEFVQNYLDKGSLVYVEGRLETRSWEKDGVKHYRTSIIADRVTPLGAKNADGGQNSPPVNQNGDSELPF